MGNEFRLKQEEIDILKAMMKKVRFKDILVDYDLLEAFPRDIGTVIGRVKDKMVVRLQTYDIDKFQE